MALYSIKMRASEKQKHISGAEKIVPDSQVDLCVSKLLQRGLRHPKGSPDLMNLKIEALNEEDILYLDALPVRTLEVERYQDGIEEIRKFLHFLKLANTEEILGLLSETYSMRGAMLLDVDTLERLEPDRERGIRATYMDRQRTEGGGFSDEKNHYEEAVVLAAKVAHAPNVIGEICISDDPEYVTGYVASREYGYCRITKMKEYGNENGGRIFLYRGNREAAADTIRFLEKQPVIVRHVKSLDVGSAPADKFRFIKDELEYMRQNHLYRRMKTIQSSQSAAVRYGNREMLMLASNDYLDMSVREDVKEYAAQILEQYGTGSGGSRLTTGNTVIHEMLEDKIAAFKNTESALVFNSGYVANLAAISALAGRGSTVFSDELNHASIIDGCRLSGAKIVVYRHNDMDDLEEKILANPCSRGLVVSDAVFSMDGDILNLPEFVRLADKYHMLSMVDEAHSTGVIGATGRGITEYYENRQAGAEPVMGYSISDVSCTERVKYISGGPYREAGVPDIIMGTLSKAVGSEGGFVCGSRLLIEYLKNKARGFIFSTSLSPVTMAASYKAFEVIEENPGLVAALQENVRFFCGCLRKKGLNVRSDTAIIPIVIGDEEKALEVSEALFREGYFISAIRYPTVKKGSARLRAALMATHTRDQLEAAAEAIAAAVGAVSK